MAFVDANDVRNDDEIWRRIFPGRPQITYEHDEGRWRPSSAAFEDSDGPDDPMSALLAREGTVARALAGRWNGWFLAELRAAVFRADEQGIARDPTPDDPNHLLVFGRKTSGRRRRWARSARWVVPPHLPPPP
jgi:hypothetical protein